jgi:hypothetical protein
MTTERSRTRDGRCLVATEGPVEEEICAGPVAMRVFEHQEMRETARRAAAVASATARHVLASSRG